MLIRLLVCVEFSLLLDALIFLVCDLMRCTTHNSRTKPLQIAATFPKLTATKYLGNFPFGTMMGCKQKMLSVMVNEITFREILREYGHKCHYIWHPIILWPDSHSTFHPV